jgi:chromosome segregation ATPase
MPRDEDVSPIPSISARRDAEATSASVPRRRGSARGRNGAEETPPGGSSRSPLVGLAIAASLLIALGACAWAWQLQESLTQTGHLIERYEKRIADLEDRLADTDEGMNQNATVQAAKIRELDSEVRKLWDNVWKRADQRLDKLEAAEKRLTGAVAAAGSTIEATQSDLGKTRADIARLQKSAGDLERFMASARSRQTEVERVADSLNAINLELARINKRVAGNEEWINAINAFRQTTNASITKLQAQLRTLGAGAGG